MRKIIRSEEYLASALKTDKGGARILDIPEALNNSYLDNIVTQSEKEIFLPDFIQKIEEGDKAIVSLYFDGFESSHAVIVDAINGSRVIIRDPLPQHIGSSYSISIADFEKLFNRKAVIIKK